MLEMQTLSLLCFSLMGSFCMECPSLQCCLHISKLTFQDSPFPLRPPCFLQPQASPGHLHLISSFSCWTIAYWWALGWGTFGFMLVSPPKLGLFGEHHHGLNYLMAPCSTSVGPCLANCTCYWRCLIYFVELNRILKRTSHFQAPSNISEALFTHLRRCSLYSRLFIRIGPLSNSPGQAEVAVLH